jgi:hypothetical protein
MRKIRVIYVMCAHRITNKETKQDLWSYKWYFTQICSVGLFHYPMILIVKLISTV